MKNFDFIRFHYESIDSTNNEAKKLLDDNVQTPFLITANNQTASRGRYGKSFYSENSGGIYISIVLPILNFYQDIPLLTIRAGVAVSKSIELVTKKCVAIKWVNDIFYNDKKVAGILTEFYKNKNGSDFVIVGIGINCSIKNIPDELKKIAISLDIDENQKTALLNSILQNFLDILNENIEDVICDYKNRSLVIDKNVKYEKNGNQFCGKCIDIDNNGRLVVLKGVNDFDILDSGEISIKL